MKNKGFTLVEILATVVILAVITLVAIPNILSSIENTKKKTAEARAQEYIEAVEKEATMNEMDGSEVLKSGKYKVSKLATYDLEFSGRHPESGYVVMNDYKVSTYSLTIGEYTITFDGTNKTVTKKEKSNNTIIYSFSTDTIFVGDTLDINERKVTTTKSFNVNEIKVDVITKTTKDLTGIYSTDKNDVLSVPSDLGDLTSEKRDNTVYIKYSVDKNNVITKIELCAETTHGSFCSTPDSSNISLPIEQRIDDIIDFFAIDAQTYRSEYSDVSALRINTHDEIEYVTLDNLFESGKTIEIQKMSGYLNDVPIDCNVAIFENEPYDNVMVSVYSYGDYIFTYYPE